MITFTKFSKILQKIKNDQPQTFFKIFCVYNENVNPFVHEPVCTVTVLFVYLCEAEEEAGDGALLHVERQEGVRHVDEEHRAPDSRVRRPGVRVQHNQHLPTNQSIMMGVFLCWRRTIILRFCGRIFINRLLCGEATKIREEKRQKSARSSPTRNPPAIVNTVGFTYKPEHVPL